MGNIALDNQYYTLRTQWLNVKSDKNEDQITELEERWRENIPSEHKKGKEET